MESPIVNNSYLLERFDGKGGWTYAIIPEISLNKSKPFGWVKVRGTIDNYAIDHCHLMPMGKGKLFLPVKAEIRKKIRKKEGDRVHIVLYFDDSPLHIPDELLICLSDEPLAHERFFALTEGRQKEFINWIYSAKTVETKAKRIAELIGKLVRGDK